MRAVELYTCATLQHPPLKGAALQDVCAVGCDTVTSLIMYLHCRTISHYYIGRVREFQGDKAGVAHLTVTILLML